MVLGGTAVAFPIPQSFCGNPQRIRQTGRHSNWPNGYAAFFQPPDLRRYRELQDSLPNSRSKFLVIVKSMVTPSDREPYGCYARWKQ
jgi:hypothetical protein